MKIAQLTVDLIPEATRGGNDALREELLDELKRAQYRGHVIYVRYGHLWLQRMLIAEEVLHYPEMKALIESERAWMVFDRDHLLTTYTGPDRTLLGRHTCLCGHMFPPLAYGEELDAEFNNHLMRQYPK